MAGSLLLALALAIQTEVDSGSDAAQLRIQILKPSEFPKEIGCVGSPIGSSEPVLAWGSQFVVVKINGRVLRLTPGKASSVRRSDQRRGDRIREEWTSDPILVILDLIATSDCRPDQQCDGSSWEGDFTAQVTGAKRETRKTIRIQIECGC